MQRQPQGPSPELYDAALQLLVALQKAMDMPASQELLNESWVTKSLPSAAMLNLPLGLEKHLAALPFPRTSDTGILPLFHHDRVRVNVLYWKRSAEFCSSGTLGFKTLSRVDWISHIESDCKMLLLDKSHSVKCIIEVCQEVCREALQICFSLTLMPKNSWTVSIKSA